LQNQQVLPHDDFISNLDVSPKELLLRGLDDIDILNSCNRRGALDERVLGVFLEFPAIDEAIVNERR
jgi:hypothetical protein